MQCNAVRCHEPHILMVLYYRTSVECLQSEVLYKFSIHLQFDSVAKSGGGLNVTGEVSDGQPHLPAKSTRFRAPCTRVPLASCWPLMWSMKTL